MLISEEHNFSRKYTCNPIHMDHSYHMPFIDLPKSGFITIKKYDAKSKSWIDAETRADDIAEIKVKPVVRPYVCETCGKDFRYKYYYKTHLAGHRKKEEKRLKVAARILDCTCKTCGKLCKNPSNLDRHQTIHTGEKRFLCHICGKGYTSKHQYMLHIVSHNGTRSTAPYLLNYKKLCEICGKSFKHPKYYYHHKFVHTSVRSHACEICEKKFKSAIHLRSHMKHVHIKNFNFHCNVCSKSFPKKEKLQNHMNIHMNVKPYKCYFCDWAFRSKSQLKGHQKRKHGIVKTKFTYESNLCEDR